MLRILQLWPMLAPHLSNSADQKQWATLHLAPLATEQQQACCGKQPYQASVLAVLCLSGFLAALTNPVPPHYH
jgi:hypothetical protein